MKRLVADLLNVLSSQHVFQRAARDVGRLWGPAERGVENRSILKLHRHPGPAITSGRLTRIGYGFLGLTLGMNAWPHLPGVAGTFTVSGLVPHILGPIVAVAIVMALPIVLEGTDDSPIGFDD